MILAGEPLAVLDLHHLPGPWMERIEDPHLERRTPGIVTLVRPVSARVGLPVRSVTRLAATIARSSIADCRGSSMRWHLHAATRLLKMLARVELLILDDWELSPMLAEQRRDLLEIMEDRHGRGSTIVTSQLPVENWHEIIGDPTIADAILDRLVHNAHRLTLKGESPRKAAAKRQKLEGEAAN